MKKKKKTINPYIYILSVKKRKFRAFLETRIIIFFSSSLFKSLKLLIFEKKKFFICSGQMFIYDIY